MEGPAKGPGVPRFKPRRRPSPSPGCPPAWPPAGPPTPPPRPPSRRALRGLAWGRASWSAHRLRRILRRRKLKQVYLPENPKAVRTPLGYLHTGEPPADTWAAFFVRLRGIRPIRQGGGLREPGWSRRPARAWSRIQGVPRRVERLTARLTTRLMARLAAGGYPAVRFSAPRGYDGGTVGRPGRTRQRAWPGQGVRH